MGTRGSPLAIAQANLVLGLLRQARSDVDFVPVIIKTLGDSVGGGKSTAVDGKTAFTGELDRSLVEGRIDAAVHSLKDVPSRIDRRLVVAATPPRGDPRDAFVSRTGEGLLRLGREDRVGTSSIRRRAQVHRLNPAVEVVELRGNVETRLRKVGPDGLSGAVLAVAGLQRLSLDARISQVFSTEEMIPAVCQGTLAVEARKDDRETLTLLSAIDDPVTRATSKCERAYSASLGGDCNVPLGGYAAITSGTLTAVGMVADPEGKEVAKASVSGEPSNAASLGKELASKVSEKGGRRILEELAP